MKVGRTVARDEFETEIEIEFRVESPESRVFCCGGPSNPGVGGAGGGMGQREQIVRGSKE